ncbi:MAG: sulfotransferase [Bacteroidales bacterium]|nr:sulfotransferase [Lentimicrobiaceae bacterium]MDD5694669.1 sulfotransferase [Bacteroidales bacterium]
MDETVGCHQASSPSFFFIIGRPRSGTTLLRFLFEAHPRVLVPPESPFIMNLYRKYRNVTEWDPSKIREFCDDVYRQRYFDKWLTGREHLYQRLLEKEGKSTFQTMVMQVWLSYNSVFEKEEIQWIGDKNPGYSLYVQRIHQLFPGAKIIHITRDYRDNYLSLIRVNFEVPIVPLVVFRWKFALKRMWKLKERIPDQIFSIRYEDLVAAPEHHFREICQFLGIPYDASVLSFYEKKSAVEKAYSNAEEIAQVHQSLFNPISAQRIDRWKTEMSPREIRIADLVAGKAAEKAGYKRQYTRFTPGLYLWILPTLIYASVMYRLILLGDHLPFALRNFMNRSLGIFLKIYWKFNKRKVNPL